MIDWDKYDQIAASSGRQVQRQPNGEFFVVHGSTKLSGPFPDNEAAAEELIKNADIEYNVKTEVAVRSEHGKPKPRPVVKKKQGSILMAL